MVRITHRRDLVSLATAYAAADEEFVIPEDLASLADDELTTLHAQAVENFDALYGDGSDLSAEDMQALAELTEGIEALAGEVATRDAAAAERASAAAELAARVRPGTEMSADTEDDGPADSEDADADAEPDPMDEDEDTEDEGAAQTIAASGAPRKATRIPLSSIRARANSRPAAQPAVQPEPSIRDVLVASGEGLGVAVGTGLDWPEVGAALDRRLQTFNESQYKQANRMGRHIREQGSLVTIKRPIPDELVIRSNDPDHVREVFDRATDESRLPGGSLVAAGGWCAPSTVLYDFLGEVESRDGLLSIPEVGVPRGGISFTTGPDFADLFAGIGGFSFTETQDIAGEYAYGTAAAWEAATAYLAGAFVTLPGGEVVVARDAGTSGAAAPAAPGVIGGTVTEGAAPNEITWERVLYATPNEVGAKPCYTITCPDFVEYRLDVDGLCLTAGILQSRGYPEVQARTVRGALVAHDHRLNGKMIATIVAGSTAIAMTTGQAGATAPILTAIELQVEHYRYTRRMARSTTLEAVFPFWVRGAIRGDLARRLGVENFLAVTDAQISAWFASRGVNAQFVYNWQAVDVTPATAFTAWPTTVSFLLYSAGTWIRGASDIITIDTLYDSVLLGNNDFTALFTEEGWFTAMRGQDSRAVSVPISSDGATHIGVNILNDGSVSA